MSSAIKTPAFQAKASNIQNEDGSSIYSGGEWSLKNASAVEQVKIDADGNTTFSGNLDTPSIQTDTMVISNAYSMQLVGNFTAGTYYPIANSSNLPSGVYMFFIYQSTYNAGAGVWQFTWSYTPAAMFTTPTNTTESVAITFSSGAGHARNAVNPPSVRIRGTPSADGKQYVEVAFPNTLSGLNGTSGKEVLVYFKRIA